jgi:hypothetical protein
MELGFNGKLRVSASENFKFGIADKPITFFWKNDILVQRFSGVSYGYEYKNNIFCVDFAD